MSSSPWESGGPPKIPAHDPLSPLIDRFALAMYKALDCVQRARDQQPTHRDHLGQLDYCDQQLLRAIHFFSMARVELTCIANLPDEPDTILYAEERAPHPLAEGDIVIQLENEGGVI